jgi:hypothetical protein
MRVPVTLPDLWRREEPPDQLTAVEIDEALSTVERDWLADAGAFDD